MNTADGLLEQNVVKFLFNTMGDCLDFSTC